MLDAWLKGWTQGSTQDYPVELVDIPYWQNPAPDSPRRIA
jgi:hypothetical protein